jgi:sulfite exporter TauE/SafE
MWYVAFTLGLFGSLHCVGMCGPLAIAFSYKKENTRPQNIYAALSYNLGRTVTYSFLGLLFGALGSFLFVVDLQKMASILLGILLIISFVFTLDLDRILSQHILLKDYYIKVRKLISKVMENSNQYHPFQLGMVNGLLPCGLVYLAMAGAIATGSLTGGVTFMFIFGLGTIPMLFALSNGYSLLSPTLRLRLRSILPYVTLVFGIFLIYRGFAVHMPSELNFWEALKNPIMCH